MFAIEKPKQPKVIKYVWWDGFNKEEVGEEFEKTYNCLSKEE